jgi:hypothetical protein
MCLAGNDPTGTHQEVLMASDDQQGCVQPAGGLVEPQETATPAASEPTSRKEERMSVRVGMSAPDFEATAFVDGAFKNVKLSDYRGRWVTLCFYPGDFTFV